VAAPLSSIQKDLDELQGRIAVAAINGPQDTVLSGGLEVLQMLATRFQARGLTAKPLRVSHAFHSHLIAPMVEEFRKVAASITYKAPAWRLISNLTAQPLGETRIDADYWCRHLLAPVLFGPSMETLRALKIDVFLEIGPHPVLIGMASKDDTEGTSAWATSLRRGRDDWSAVLAALGELYLRGAGFDAKAVELPARPRKLVLPTYPFERARYWMDPPKFLTAMPESAVRSAASGEVVLEIELSTAELPWCRDFRVRDNSTLPAAGYVTLILDAYERSVGARPMRITAFEIEVPFVPVPSEPGRLQVSLTPEDAGWRCLVAVRGGETRGPWTVLARARLEPEDGAQATTGGAADVREFTLDAPRNATLAGILDAAIWKPLEALHEGYVVSHARSLFVAPGLIGAGNLTCRVHMHAGSADVDVRDAQGALRLTATGLVLRAAAPGEVDRTMRLHHPLVYDLAWQPAALPEQRRVQGNWVVFADADGVGVALAGQLRESGATVTLWHARDVATAERGATALHARLAKIAGGKPLAGVAYLWGLDASATETDVPAATRTAAADALALLQALTRDAEPTPVLIATRAVTGAADWRPDGVIQAPLWGLGRVVRAENAGMRLQLVDLDPAEEPAAHARQLAGEIEANDQEDWQIAWRDGRRLAIRLAGSTLPPPRAAVTFHADATYLVTGGLGGLGLRAAEWMAAQGARHLVLVGRSAPSQEALAGMARIAAMGATAHPVRTDVADRAQVAALLSGIPATRPLRGIVHAAGVLDDGLARDLTVERLARVMSPKVDGAWHLHELSRAAPIDFFVMFASSAGLFGSPGQANYAAANTVLDTLAQARRAAGLPATSIDWGPWGEVGMAARLGARDQERLASGGVSPLGVDEGLEAMGQAILTGRPHFVGMDIDWVKIWKTLGDARPAFLRDFAPRVRASGTAAAPQAVSAAAGTTLRELPAEQRLPLLAAQVREQLRAVLALDADYKLSDEQSFVELGMDSLVAVELSNRLKPLVGRPLGATVAFDHPTVTQMVAHLNSLFEAGSGDAVKTTEATHQAAEESWVL
jgi:NAD(P)-dependent dehydrogenase (short-subunit alcohol dehydrogenase family)/acyl carrier protein